MQFNLKNIFLTGLAVIVPVGLTIYILVFLIGMMDGLLAFIPLKYHSTALIGVYIPGLGIIITILLIFICGLMTKSMIGNRIVLYGERLLDGIPIVRSIHMAIKKIVDSMVLYRNRGFKKVVLVEFPRKGAYTVAFVTGAPGSEINSKTGRRCISVYVPTTPNPTSGYFIIFPEDEVVQLEMSVEDAFTLIISGGIVNPPDRLQKGQILT
ncbi:MAG: DUF502 domain-containing protein [Pseudomonadota bacterium]